MEKLLKEIHDGLSDIRRMVGELDLFSDSHNKQGAYEERIPLYDKISDLKRIVEDMRNDHHE